MNPNLPSRNAIFNFIVEFKRKNDGLSPTLREIVDGAGISSMSVVYFHLKVLAGQGRIRITRGANRGIVVVGGEWQFHEEYLPLPVVEGSLGTVDNL